MDCTNCTHFYTHFIFCFLSHSLVSSHFSVRIAHNTNSVLFVWNKHIFSWRKCYKCYKLNLWLMVFLIVVILYPSKWRKWYQRCGVRDELFRLGRQASLKHFVYFLKTVILHTFSSLRDFSSDYPHTRSLAYCLVFACSSERLMEREHECEICAFLWAKWILEVDIHHFALVLVHYFSL